MALAGVAALGSAMRGPGEPNVGASVRCRIARFPVLLPDGAGDGGRYSRASDSASLNAVTVVKAIPTARAVDTILPTVEQRWLNAWQKFSSGAG